MKMKLNSNLVFNIVLFALVMLVCLYTALSRIYFSDFFPINGDFQNYNGYRRILNGQVPFRDFYFYLGLGPLYTKTVILFILGNNFTMSLAVTNFVTALFFSSSIFLISYLNITNIKRSLILTLLLILTAAGLKGEFHLFDIFNQLPFLDNIHPGNSDRMVRSFLPFIFVYIFLFFNKISKIKKKINNSFVYGIFLGAGIAWSNDYGISVLIAGTIIYCLLYFRLKFLTSFIKKKILFILGILLGCYSLVSILTLGHFTNWFNYNFLNVANYQLWYYGINPNTKLLKFSDIPINFEILCSLLIIVNYSVQIIKKSNNNHNIMLLFLYLTTFIAGFAYAFGSEKVGLFPPMYMVLYVSLLSQIINRLKFVFMEYLHVRILINSVIIIIVTSLVTNGLTSAINNLKQDRVHYVQELKGYLSAYGEELQYISNKYIKNSNADLFSTYSSALEVINSEYQPSGIDYIIHVLGDKYRKLYLESFLQNPQFVTTIREDFTQWEFWSKRENWFFYRKLLENYKPIAATSYNILWEKQKQNQFITDTKLNVTLNQISNDTVEIYVKSNDIIDNAIADISIAYTSGWNKNRFNKFDFGLQRIVSVRDGWSDNSGYYNLPKQTEDIAIPIKLSQGFGKATISSYPLGITNIEVNIKSINSVLPDVPNDLSNLVDYLQAVNLTDENWIKGVSRTQKTILFKNTVSNRSEIQSAKYLNIQSNNRQFKIKSINYPNKEWIHVLLEDDIPKEIIQYPTKLNFLK
ncbi:hypothetical protein BC351_32010 [Paenibacillus ferrarius]|uniref:Uncharacterized protein n=1 Tax=Paenibacillus ferrarius TaxID=1469647 RepID=A0A1V4HEN7_9BACL|nr:hypothetical protein [Paenibacillus ferrarius]OPH53106.1 hypothetical protein BC351_32010 [Paenibacillus ferrarius]